MAEDILKAYQKLCKQTDSFKKMCIDYIIKELSNNNNQIEFNEDNCFFVTTDDTDIIITECGKLIYLNDKNQIIIELANGTTLNIWNLNAETLVEICDAIDNK